MNNTLSTMIPFDPTKYDGYIFDCDGTLADTMPLHYRAWNETFSTIYPAHIRRAAG